MTAHQIRDAVVATGKVAVALAITAALTYLVAAAFVAWTVPASRYR